MATSSGLGRRSSAQVTGTHMIEKSIMHGSPDYISSYYTISCHVSACSRAVLVGFRVAEGACTRQVRSEYAESATFKSLDSEGLTQANS